jgi:error-prone DNA polymerase
MLLCRRAARAPAEPFAAGARSGRAASNGSSGLPLPWGFMQRGPAVSRRTRRDRGGRDPRQAQDSIEAAIGTPLEARLSPFPRDDLVQTPGPRRSLAPFGIEDESGPRLGPLPARQLAGARALERESAAGCGAPGAVPAAAPQREGSSPGVRAPGRPPEPAPPAAPGMVARQSLPNQDGAAASGSAQDPTGRAREGASSAPRSAGPQALWAAPRDVAAVPREGGGPRRSGRAGVGEEQAGQPPSPASAPSALARGAVFPLRDLRQPARSELPARPRSAPPAACDYVELHARSAFSFLRASSLPEDLAAAAADAGHATFGVADVGGLYGAPRFHLAAKRAGLRPIVGAEIEVEGAGTVALLCEDGAGYRNLCRLLTLGHEERESGRRARAPGSDDSGASRPQGKAPGKTPCQVTPAQLFDLRHGLLALSNGTPAQLVALAGTLGNERVFAEVQRHLDPREERDNRRRIHAARARGVRLVAGGGVRHAKAQGKPLYDALTCIREGVTLDGAGRLLSRNAERHVRPPRALAHDFRDLPDAIANTRLIAERCAYTLGDLDYRFPEPRLQFATTLDGELWHRTLQGAKQRYGGVHSPRWPAALAQVERELHLIARLGLAGYFLIVHDLVLFCAAERILAQGRGSAANSAVCYSLGITAVDPVGMGLLFERFLSEERSDMNGHKSWPDIDLDLPSGDQREKVIQHVYQRYGARGAAMTANVITYRARSASREIGKVLGLPQQELDRLAHLLPHFEFTTDLDTLEHRAREAGLGTGDRRVQLYLQLCQQIAGLPRHLGQHSGGMIIAAGRLDEIVPLEPASMPGRTVVQWDKDDCADLGIIKVDLLGLGMMSVLEQALPLIRAHEGVEVDLAQLPAGDPGVYDLLQKADTVGVFQVESRAQMATLPRMRPTCFYDLVVEVAIIRPGPIVGQMVNPYLERRAGRQAISVPHPALWPVLQRTLGIPLFQEQLMRIAMVAGNFSGGEADELRRAMGSKRSMERMKALEARLRAGMTSNGIALKAQDEIVLGITSFALYGFPESHAASFALLVYASAYLKVHHPHAFYAAMLNCWPMGFYSPATLVKDAQRRGVRVKAVDAARSDWLCTLERAGPEEELCLRLGLRYVRGLRQQAGQRLVAARADGPFASIADFAARAGMRRDELTALAEIGALASIPARPGEPAATRRAALWQAEAASRRGAGLFARVEPREELESAPREDSESAPREDSESAPREDIESAPRSSSPLPEMDLRQRVAADLRGTGLTVGPHPVALERARLSKLGIQPAGALPKLPAGRRVRTGGLCIVRQRPGTAKGFVFLSLEDETGIANIVIDPATFEANRQAVLSSALLIVEGRLEQYDGVTSLKADRFWPMHDALGKELRSRDFH